MTRLQGPRLHDPRPEGPRLEGSRLEEPRLEGARPEGQNRPALPSAEAPDRVSTEATARLRRVHRAASDLRRGIPVVLSAGETMLGMLAAETAAAGSIAELASLASEPPLLLLAPTRAAAVLRRPVEQAAPAVAVRVPENLLLPETLRALADPGLTPVPPDRLGDSVPPPALAGAALALGKLAGWKRTWNAAICCCCPPPTCSPIPATSPARCARWRRPKCRWKMRPTRG